MKKIKLTTDEIKFLICLQDKNLSLEKKQPELLAQAKVLGKENLQNVLNHKFDYNIKMGGVIKKYERISSLQLVTLLGLWDLVNLLLEQKINLEWNYVNPTQDTTLSKKGAIHFLILNIKEDDEKTLENILKNIFENIDESEILSKRYLQYSLENGKFVIFNIIKQYTKSIPNKIYSELVSILINVIETNKTIPITKEVLAKIKKAQIILLELFDNNTTYLSPHLVEISFSIDYNDKIQKEIFNKILENLSDEDIQKIICIDEKRDFLLKLACQDKNLTGPLFKLLLRDQSKPLKYQRFCDKSPLIHAITNKNLTAVLKILEWIKSITKENKDDLNQYINQPEVLSDKDSELQITPLQSAISLLGESSSKQEDDRVMKNIILCLIKYGADPLVKSSEGLDAFVYMAERQNAVVENFQLIPGLEKALKNYPENDINRPLYAAIQAKNLALVKYIVELGGAAITLQSYEEHINYPLAVAISHGDRDIINFLYKKVQEATNNKYTQLINALNLMARYGLLDLFKIYLREISKTVLSEIVIPFFAREAILFFQKEILDYLITLNMDLDSDHFFIDYALLRHVEDLKFENKSGPTFFRLNAIPTKLTFKPLESKWVRRASSSLNIYKIVDLYMEKYKNINENIESKLIKTFKLALNIADLEIIKIILKYFPALKDKNLDEELEFNFHASALYYLAKMWDKDNNKIKNIFYFIIKQGANVNENLSLDPNKKLTLIDIIDNEDLKRYLTKFDKPQNYPEIKPSKIDKEVGIISWLKEDDDSEIMSARKYFTEKYGKDGNDIYTKLKISITESAKNPVINEPEKPSQESLKTLNVSKDKTIQLQVIEGSNTLYLFNNTGLIDEINDEFIKDKFKKLIDYPKLDLFNGIKFLKGGLADRVAKNTFLSVNDKILTGINLYQIKPNGLVNRLICVEFDFHNTRLLIPLKYFPKGLHNNKDKHLIAQLKLEFEFDVLTGQVQNYKSANTLTPINM